VRSAARARSGDYVVETIAVDVATGHEHPAGERGIVCKEAADFHSAQAVKYLHVRPAAAAGAGDDVGHAVAGNVSRRNSDAAKKARAIREETEFLGAGLSIKDLDMRSAAGIRAGHQNVVRNH